MTDLPLTIVADENIPALEPLFERFGELRTYPGRTLAPDQVRDADVLLVRSVTQVNAELLAGSSVRFVGTATIGTDHVDQAWLVQQGIGFSSAPGCNADSVVDYVFAALLHTAQDQGFDLRSKTLGIVGVGNVGRRLQARMEKLGVRLLLCDPPRAEAESDDESFVPLEQVLSDADIICLHTPLTRDGDWPTLHLLNEDNLPLLKADVVLLNAGRGPVIDNKALLGLVKGRPHMSLILDVWEDEPWVEAELAACCNIATPHIAGYALDGKIRGTWMLYQALCKNLGLSVDTSLEDVLPAAPVSSMQVFMPENLLAPVRAVYDIYRDDRAFRAMLKAGDAEIRQGFDRLRRFYPERREFSTLKLSGELEPDQARQFAALGFGCGWGNDD